MPKSKPTRKKYVSGRHAVLIPGTKPCDIKDIKDQIAAAETAVRIKLPLGKASYGDLAQVRDLFNCLMFSLMHHQKAIDQGESAAAGDEVAKAGVDLTTVLRRGIKEDRYVCRASEMTSILAGLQTASDFITDSLDLCPQTLVTEFNGSLLIRDALPEHGEIVVRKRTCDLAYRLSQQMSKIRDRDFPIWHQRAISQLRNHMQTLSLSRQRDMEEKECQPIPVS